jgi:hypothetical protein
VWAGKQKPSPCMMAKSRGGKGLDWQAFEVKSEARPAEFEDFKHSDPMSVPRFLELWMELRPPYAGIPKPAF